MFFKANTPAIANRRSLTLDQAFVVFILYLFVAPILSFCIVAPAEKFFPPLDQYDAAPTDVDDPDSVFNPEHIATQHPMARLLIRSRFTPYFGVVVCVFFLTVVCFAPLVEEFVFRATLQGAFERAFGVEVPSSLTETNTESLSQEESEEFHHLEKKVVRFRRLRVAAAILIPAVLFAAMHAGTPDNPESPENLSALFSSVVQAGASYFLAFVIGLWALLNFFGVNSRDLGLEKISSLKSAGRVFRDWIFGVALFLFASVIIFGANAYASYLFPGEIIAPIPIFLFAIYEGCVYRCVKKFAVVLGMHMGLNFVSFVMLLSLVL